MSLTPEKKDEIQTIRANHDGETKSEPIDPRPWTAPAFLERSTCAEIGAYAFQDKQ